jgi:hypothetical protein
MLQKYSKDRVLAIIQSYWDISVSQPQNLVIQPSMSLLILSNYKEVSTAHDHSDNSLVWYLKAMSDINNKSENIL